jgi:hypothetical protein
LRTKNQLIEQKALLSKNQEFEIDKDSHAKGHYTFATTNQEIFQNLISVPNQFPRQKGLDEAY